MSKARAGERIDALKRHDRPIRFEGDVLSRAFAPRQNPLNAPPLAIDAAPYVCLIVNASWVSHVLGVLETLEQPDAWIGDETEKDRAQNEIRRLMEMLMIGDACMLDPCCPETNEILTEIKILNQTIVNNQLTIIDQNTTIIDNDTTIINQNDEITVNNLIQQFNQIESVNQQFFTLNQLIYDGTPQSIAPNIGENWNSGGTDGTLCAAVKNYIDYAIYQRTNELNQEAYLIGAISAAAVAASIAAAGITGGLSIVAGMVVAGVAGTYGLALSAWNTSVSDPQARQDVVCCMFDHLKDQPVNFDTFKAAVEDCSFDVGTNQSNIAALVHGCNQLEYNYQAFLRAMTGTPTDAGACSCCEAQIIAVNNCIVTPLGNCQWRIVQSNGVDGPGDPFCSEGYTYYNAEFKDAENRCIDIIASSGTAMSSYEQIDCDDNPVSGVGGGGGQGKFFHWTTKACPPDTTFLDITITVALVE